MKEALELALEALEYWDVQGGLHQPTEEAITAIKAALAQPTSGDYVQPDLSVLKHSDNCRYWDDGEFCTCGALEYHEMQYWKARALAQPVQQEPTGMLHIDRLDKWLDASLKERKAQRTWVDLAPEDRLCAKYMLDAPEGIEAVIDYITAKLKEKNNGLL